MRPRPVRVDYQGLEKDMPRITGIAQRGRLAIVVGLSIAMVGGFTLGSTASAFAAAGTRASCMALEASNISPPGSSTEVPGGMAEFNAFIRENFPRPKGAVNREIAELHAGSHQACDEATG
jgi:hypothetical protein